ncbi:hypothetical protein [Clostridium baratii]|uniref:hypothetical protein n=1 Tax=Clostridium baratii TaxID=1561 RepID=UPI0005F2D7A5|nr:hypothetical protein [Clostridium baratii]AQM58951.1 hypothetical protein NPD11_728 [Clostridium baratii]KJU72989.1 hypothetical protein UC77_03140 [Clostridium baratii]MBS6043992.1 hypothetical protein [Clostridium baratii]
MKKENAKSIVKCILIGGVWSILAIIAAIIIKNLKSYSLADIIFCEGILFILIGALSCIGGSSRGLFFKENNTSNVQFTASDLKGNTKYERDNELIRKVLPLSIIKLSLIIGGIINCIISMFII